MQDYLKFMSNRDRRRIFAKFRTGSHWLQVHVGRFSGVNRQDRLCPHCDMKVVEDEEHTLLRCPKFDSIRIRYGQLFPCRSLEDLFQNEQATIARFIEECHDCTASAETH